ncbi:MAG: CoA pyrophosphatase [Myxococcota bacterium]
MRSDPTIPADLGARLLPIAGPLPEVPPDLRLAAVIALLMRDTPAGGPGLLLIERSSSLRAHAGQIAFPGGKPEPEDGTLLDTALREAREEVGLPESGTTVLGRLWPVPTPTGFLIIPYVGWAPEGWVPEATSPEVHHILTPTLALLADPAIHRVTHRGMLRGFAYELHEFKVHKPAIWGATANMVWELLLHLDLRP